MSEESEYKNIENKNCGIKDQEKRVGNCGSLKIPTGLLGIAF
jgi:hypothetical protein